MIRKLGIPKASEACVLGTWVGKNSFTAMVLDGLDPSCKQVNVLAGARRILLSGRRKAGRRKRHLIADFTG